MPIGRLSDFAFTAQYDDFWVIRLMTIGEQLKKTRNMLELTQLQMSAGIITGSFYSRVERGQSKINVIDLVKILNSHKVSLYDFFEPFEKDNFSKKTIDYKIYSAFDSKNIGELKNIQKKVSSNSKAFLQIQLMIAILQDRVDALPEDLHQDMQHKILQIGSWNKKSLWELSLTMNLYETNELSILLGSVFEKFAEIDFEDNEVLIPLANILINYLVSSYQQNYLSKCQEVLKYLDKLPANPQIALPKILGKYYQAKIAGDNNKADAIQRLLVKSGYKTYLRK